MTICSNLMERGIVAAVTVMMTTTTMILTACKAFCVPGFSEGFLFFIEIDALLALGALWGSFNLHLNFVTLVGHTLAQHSNNWVYQISNATWPIQLKQDQILQIFVHP